MSDFLRSLTHCSLKGERFAAHILKVRRSELNADAADFLFNVSEMSHRGHFYVRLESVGIGLLKPFKLSRPRKRTDNINIDSVLAPFRCGNP